MGLLDLFRRKPEAPAPAPVEARPPTEEAGIPGNANFGGRLVVEPNAALRDQSGYGRAGTYDFGEWDEIVRSNPFVAAGLDFVLGPIRDARLDVEEPSEEAIPDEATRRAVTDFVRWNLSEKLPLAQFAAQAAHGFLGAGFALFEPLYEVASHPALPRGAPGFALKRLAERLPNSLHTSPWLEDETGSLLAVRQQGPVGGSGRWVDVQLPVSRLLLFSWQRKGNNWQGKSAFRAVWYIAARVMPELLKLIGVTLQREGAGIPIVSATDAKTPLTAAQRTELVNLLSGLVFHEGASAVLPPGWKLDWVFSGGSNKGHVLEVWQQLGVSVLQQVGAQQLALGTSDTGSRSVGETHDARAMAYVRSVVGFLESVLNGNNAESPTPGLVQSLVAANWGELPAYPRVKLTLKRPQLDPKTRMEAIGLAKSAGLLTVTADDENHVREELGLAPIDADEREAQMPGAVAEPGTDAPQLAVVPAVDGAEKAADTALNGAQVAAATDLLQRVADGKLPYEAALEALVTFFNLPREAAVRLMQTLRTFEPAAAAPVTASAPRGEWKPWRPLRASESKLKLADMDAYFTARRDDFERLAKPVVVAMLSAAAKDITVAMSDGDPSEVAQLPLNTARLDVVIRAFLAETRKAGASFVREELRGRATLKAEEEDELPAIDTKAMDEIIEAQAKALSRRMQARLRAELEREAIDVVQRGGDAGDVVERTVARQLDSGAFRGDAGYVTTRAFSLGREEAAAAMGGVDTVERTAILDSGTCDACRAKDGATADFNSDEHDALMTPEPDCAGGDSCRCLLIFRRGGS